MARVLVTGGAGFIGSNLTERLISLGHEVIVFDNLSRPGTQANLEWLRERHGQHSFRLVCADVRDYDALVEASRGVEQIYHLAAQTAVTTSVVDPRSDFEVNALGTLNALEAARLVGRDPVFVYTSTNKVYGAMEDLAVLEEPTRYAYRDLTSGVPETRPLDFHSPYGCSKGAADQYVRDYSRIYGLRSVVFRQSCIFGPRQMGVEDQGWLAWFAIAAMTDRPITIYGDGKQVRDVLYIDDLVRALVDAVERVDLTAGRVYNIGGGPTQTIAVWAEFGPMLEHLLDKRIAVSYGDWRPGDQQVYVSDTRKAGRDFNWEPRIKVEEGINLLVEWVRENQGLFR